MTSKARDALAEGEVQKRKRRAKGAFGPRRADDFRVYIKKVLRDVAPGHGITKSGLGVLNHIVTTLRDRIVAQAVVLTRYGNKKAVTCREIQTATFMILGAPKRTKTGAQGEELARHAVSNGLKAVLAYGQSKLSTAPTTAVAPPDTADDDDAVPDADMEDAEAE